METSCYPRVAAGGRRVRAVLTHLAVRESPARGVAVGSVLYALAIVLRLPLGFDGFAFLTFFPVIGLSALAGGAIAGTFFAALSLLTA